MHQLLASFVNLEQYALNDEGFRKECKRTLDEKGALVIRHFLKKGVIEAIQKEGEEQQHLAYYTNNNHNIYLAPPDDNYPMR